MLLLTVLMLTACKPTSADHSDTPNPESTSSLAPEARTIRELTDRRDTEALLASLAPEASEVAQLTALQALASYEPFEGDTVVMQGYVSTNPALRAAAYHATGQLGCASCMPAMMDQLAIENDPDALVDLYEGIGKVARLIWDARLDSLITTSADHRRGAAWHLYRCGLRGDLADGDEDRAFFLLEEPDVETRLGAAHFLARTRDLDLTRYLDNLESLIYSEPEVEVQIGLVGAMRHVNGVLAAPTLEELAQNVSRSPLVRVQALRAYRNVRRKSAPLIRSLVLDPDHQVRATAATLLAETDHTPAELDALRNQYNTRFTDRGPLAELEGAWLKTHLDQGGTKVLCEAVDTTTHAYHRAALVAALREAPLLPEGTLERWLVEDTAAIVRTTACETLIHLVETGQPHTDQTTMIDLAELVMATGDATAMGLMAGHLANPDMGYKDMLAGWQWIQDARDALDLPAQYETAVALDGALAYLEGREYIQPKPDWNHAPAWDVLDRMGQQAVAVVETDRGTFTMALDVVGCPTVAANFAQLAESGYFDGKAFHRVVPNFVIQTGCPRGDGWGSTDFTIRSDFAPHRYRAGSVGMASLGADTESCQWFVTHSATPHLEGRYSVFAQVVAGMDVVHKVGVGDRILSVQMQYDGI